MYYLSANAVRTGQSIAVTVSGYLANSCVKAKIEDKYPGGNIQYVVDPGHAQVFIEESTKPGSHICLQALVPWTSEVVISDESHDTVEIFVNGDNQVTVPVQQSDSYIVVALVGTPPDKNIGCNVVHESNPYLAIYRKVYGPNTKANCDSWVHQSCEGAAKLQSVATLNDGEYWPFPWSDKPNQ